MKILTVLLATLLGLSAHADQETICGKIKSMEYRSQQLRSEVVTVVFATSSGEVQARTYVGDGLTVALSLLQTAYIAKSPVCVKLDWGTSGIKSISDVSVGAQLK